jgi:hypothetical protein
MLGVGVSEESRCVVCKTRASGQEPTVEGLIHQCVVYTFMSNAVKVLNCSRLPCPTSDCCCPAAQLRTRSQQSSCSTTVSALPPNDDVGYLHSSAIFQSVNVSQCQSIGQQQPSPRLSACQSCESLVYWQALCHPAIRLLLLCCHKSTSYHNNYHVVSRHQSYVKIMSITCSLANSV